MNQTVNGCVNLRRNGRTDRRVGLTGRTLLAAYRIYHLSDFYHFRALPVWQYRHYYLFCARTSLTILLFPHFGAPARFTASAFYHHSAPRPVSWRPAFLQSVNRRINEPSNQSTNRNQTICRSINPSVSHAIARPSKRPIDESVNR